MSRSIRPALSFIASLAFAFAACVPSTARSQEPDRVLVGIYHVATGKQLDFLRWQAAREAVDKEAGLPAAQWYAHMDGDSWDFISIAPVHSDAQDQKVQEILKRRNMTSGFKSALEFRTLIASHTDTYARGPTTAAALVEAASK